MDEIGYSKLIFFGEVFVVFKIETTDFQFILHFPIAFGEMNVRVPSRGGRI